MSLNFFADAALTIRITDLSPKRFLIPNKGRLRISQIWLGDPYNSICTTQADPGDTTIELADTSEFLTSVEISSTSGGIATAKSGTNTFTYTGKTQSHLTGVSGITVAISIGDNVYPDVIYKGIAGANIETFPTGADQTNFGLRLAVGATPTLGFPTLPAIFVQTSVSIGVSNAVKVYLSIQIPEGIDQEFTNLGVKCNNLYKRDSADTTIFSQTEGTYGPLGSLYVYRHDEALPIPVRVLPINRYVSPNAPGFIVGQYRWRGKSDRNATTLIPTNWNIDLNKIGLEKFIAGIGDKEDLAPIQLIEEQDSIRMQVNRGEYFTGANRYYLPANSNLEFLQSGDNSANPDGTVTLHLQNVPREQAPIFVGTYILDSQQYYEKSTEYKYIATIFNPDKSQRSDLPEFYFTLNRNNKTITLNKAMPTALLFLGTVSGQATDYFDIPVYPVENIVNIYIDRGAGSTPLYATSWQFDKEMGTVQVPNIVGSLVNQPIFAKCLPAVAVLYDLGIDEVQQVETVDLNPAFSGLAGGYFYLQHRKQKPASLVLSCDKPRITVPATHTSIIGLVAFGPVYFENDFALLSVTAYGNTTGETIANALLDVVVDSSTFSGTINYKDPLTETVSVVTGGDGTANLIFIPKGGFGVYIPTIPAAGILGGLATTSITNDTLVLPANVPLDQVWNVAEGWLVTTYKVFNNDPLFGMVGGNTALGQIIWQTTGTPGASNYKTNGERDAWRSGNVLSGNIIYPIDALDSTGVSYSNPSFNGNVKKLIYATAIPTDVSIGAYFVTFIQRILVKMNLRNSNLFSNSILLQMATPDLISENPWLVLNDAVQGRLDQFRLGYVKPPDITFVPTRPGRLRR